MQRAAFVVLLLAGARHGFARGEAMTTVVPVERTIAAGVPLRIRIDRSVPLRLGQKVSGHLTEPVYVMDRMVLPAGAEVAGVVAATLAQSRSIRVNAKLDGDFTPLRQAVVRFDTVELGDGNRVAMAAEGMQRRTEMIRLGAGRGHASLREQAATAIRERVAMVRSTIHDPHKGDLLKQALYRQLPYHPQEIWAGSNFDADLKEPLALETAHAAEGRSVAGPGEDGKGVPPGLASGTIRARLTSPLSSKSAKRGDAVTATVVQPLVNPARELVLPEGATLTGTVQQTKAARSFGRNGALRFTFREVQAPTAAGLDAVAGTQVHATLTGAEGAKDANLAVDAEGGTHATPQKDRFLAPLVLAVLATASQDEDGGLGRIAVSSNGFGLVARVISVSVGDKNIATGFAAYALSKSVYRRLLAKGHEVEFPRDTMIELELSTR